MLIENHAAVVFARSWVLFMLAVVAWRSMQCALDSHQGQNAQLLTFCSDFNDVKRTIAGFETGFDTVWAIPLL